MPPSVVYILYSRDGAVEAWAHLVPYHANESAFPMLSRELLSIKLDASSEGSDLEYEFTVCIDDSHQISSHGWQSFICGSLSAIVALEDDHGV